MSKLITLVFAASLFGELVFASQFPKSDGRYGSLPSEVVDRITGDSKTTGSGATPTSTNEVGKLRYSENTGECETTTGVYQASGYGEIAHNQSMWFWLFEARNNPDQAPLTLWINGGPGSTSMLGLFQENGPCRITQDGQTYTHNNYSWNNVSNVIYIDQPIGAGFSFGTIDVMNSKEAAAAVWDFFQIFYADEKFSKYANRDFGIWTESYGGHYGPAFAAYFLDQNEAIKAGQINGTIINLKTLGVGNGLTDGLTQYPGYVQYAMENPYFPTANESVIQAANNSLYEKGGCLDLIKECQKRGNDNKKGRKKCLEAQLFCAEEILSPLIGDLDVYNIREYSNGTYPPDITPLMTNSTFTKAIGATEPWQEASTAVYINFSEGGDWMVSLAPELEQVINAGVRTVIYDGDADYILNFKGVENMVANLNTTVITNYSSTQFSNYTVNGEPAGLVKNFGTFSYLRVFGAGHEVPAYNYTNLEIGQAALQFFSQATAGGELTST